MPSKPLSSLLADLDVTRSHNRPRTSNDNPYSEAQFKTMKYTPDYPGRFDSIGHARSWMEEFMTWYNHEHRHSRIGLHTPASVHYGTAHDIRAARQGHPRRRLARPPRTVQPTPHPTPTARTRHDQRSRETNPRTRTSEGLRRLI